MKRYIKILISIIICIVVSQKFCLGIEPSAFYFSPASSEPNTGETLILNLNIYSPEEKIYSFDLNILYPASRLNFSGFVEENSDVYHWVNKKQNDEGIINLTGGFQSGFLGRGNIIGLKFTVEKPGQAEIKIQEGALLLNQNQQNIVGPNKPAKLTIAQSSTLIPTGISTAIPSPVPTVFPASQDNRSVNTPFILGGILILFLLMALGYFMSKKGPKLPLEKPSPPLPEPSPFPTNPTPPVTKPENEAPSDLRPGYPLPTFQEAPSDASLRREQNPSEASESEAKGDKPNPPPVPVEETPIFPV